MCRASTSCLVRQSKTWMAGTIPAMTVWGPSCPRQIENPLGDDAEHHLGGAALDRIGLGAQPGARPGATPGAVSYTHLRAHETDSYLVCRLLLEKKKTIFRLAI